ncbi:hypothetical protein OG618_02690 [Kitasatospora sp. NBC_01246]|uniref:hypothetical protein n=1 Tax=Kitasatospora sp. NBC_01246 TaxID=2903570 RepID=UPI002E35D5AE|nr:hypothetical protein [Kitasatospora sp. NBC_01246]
MMRKTLGRFAVVTAAMALGLGSVVTTATARPATPACGSALNTIDDIAAQAEQAISYRDKGNAAVGLTDAAQLSYAAPCFTEELQDLLRGAASRFNDAADTLYYDNWDDAYASAAAGRGLIWQAQDANH